MDRYSRCKMTQVLKKTINFIQEQIYRLNIKENEHWSEDWRR